MKYKENLQEPQNKVSNKYDSLAGKNAAYVDSRYSITYENPDPKKREEKPEITQNYLNMNDIAVPVIIKKGDDGQIYFAMQYTYIPAIKKNLLELPAIAMENQKENYDNDDVFSSISNLVYTLNLHTSNNIINNLTEKFDPVSQSFTNQTAKLVELGVKNEQGDKRLHWFPVSCLEDLLSRNDISMSIQSKYALLLFADKHKKEIEKTKPTKANVNKKLLYNAKPYGNRENDEVVWPHKYRFGVGKEQTPGEIQDLNGTGEIDYSPESIYENKDGISTETSVYGMSKDSIQCVILRKINGKYQVGLAPQHRSPFISKKSINEQFIETVAGMIDSKDYQNIDPTSDEYKKLDYDTKRILDYYAGKNAAVREAREEFGLTLDSDSLIPLSQDLLLSHGTEEFSKFYLYKLPEDYVQSKQNTDEDESIGNLDWYDLNSLDINSLHAPMPTKIALLMARNYLEREKERKTEYEKIEPR